MIVKNFVTHYNGKLTYRRAQEESDEVAGQGKIHEILDQVHQVHRENLRTWRRGSKGKVG